MKIKNLTISTLFLTFGLVLHIMVPGTLGLMKPDFMLAMFFFSLFHLETIKEVLVVSVVCGFLTALTTSLPGGEFANIIDKLVSGPIVFYGFKICQRYLNESRAFQVMTILGTLLSGTLFLMVLRFIGGIQLPISYLMVGVVLPAIVGNTFLIMLVRKIYNRINRKNTTNLQHKF
ncbi:tryptophan transporter [Erysipelothrix tonsillarum]|uniref:tryptophan transporter n=1 Tax=Erysipelothrix tonsillarum TaxID=38402 RepID=UPI00036501B3|nr:tryptophan transporter [Erysipelothrix tonsillarum]